MSRLAEIYIRLLNEDQTHPDEIIKSENLEKTITFWKEVSRIIQLITSLDQFDYITEAHQVFIWLEITI